MKPNSDLNLAIVDPDYYHFLDREIRSYERRLEKGTPHEEAAWMTFGRRQSRRFYTYRYQHLPNIACVQAHNAHISEAPVERCCGIPRPITAFIYRDWWSVYSRCEYDLKDLRKKLADPTFPAGGDMARTFPLPLDRPEVGQGAEPTSPEP
jgi:hypothetical protein